MAAFSPEPSLREPPVDINRGLRYLLIGGFNTVFGIAVFTLLHLTLEPSVGYMPVLVAAWIINVLENFVAYRLVVFRVSGQLLLDLLRFCSVYTGAFLFNLAALPFAVEMLDAPVLATQCTILVLTVVVSYLGHSRFSFRRSEDAPVPEDAPVAAEAAQATRPR